MKNKFLIFLISFSIIGCTQQDWSDIFDNASNQILEQTLLDSTETTNNLIFDESGNLVPDFIPALQPFVNEGCQTAWDNLSAIIDTTGEVIYFINLRGL